MRRTLILSVLSLLAIYYLLPATHVVAQTDSPEPTASLANIVLTATPLNPAPNSPVTVVVGGSGINLDASDISWRVNGKQVLAGRGEKRLDTTTGAAGSKLLVEVTVSSDSDNLTASITIIAGAVDLLWQGDTYTPPLYLGRTLWSNQSSITIVAIPHIGNAAGGEMNPATLIYKWSKDGTVLGDASGVGKRSITFNDSVLSFPTTVRVDIILPDGSTLVGGSSINLRPILPQILVVEDNPLYGLMLHNALGNRFNLKESEVSFTALPIFAWINTRFSPAEVYTWTTNTGDSRQGNRVTYRVPENTEGTSSVTLRVENKSTLASPAEKNFLVQFGGSSDF